VAAKLSGIHHVAIICSDYSLSKDFYSKLLGLQIVAENYRPACDSWKLDLQLPDGSKLELFSFPNPPLRPSQPEAQGLRHLAFKVAHLADYAAYLIANGIAVEPVRIDEFTGKHYTFFQDPDGLPLELYQQ
jgi:glyoxylase I family protein